MAVDLSPLFSTEYPEPISLEGFILYLGIIAFLGFILGVVAFLANDARSI